MVGIDIRVVWRVIFGAGDRVANRYSKNGSAGMVWAAHGIANKAMTLSMP